MLMIIPQQNACFPLPPLWGHLALESNSGFRLILHWNQTRRSGSSCIGRFYVLTFEATVCETAQQNVATRVPRSMELYSRACERIAGRTHLFGRRPELQAFGISPIYSAQQK